MPRLLWLLAMFAAVLMTAQSLGYAYGGSGWAAPSGAIGVSSMADCGEDHFCAVGQLAAGGPVARAGVRVGDSIREDRLWEQHRRRAVDEQIGMTWRHAGRERHLELITAAGPVFFAPTYILSGIVLATVCLVALLVLARAGRQWTGFFLGLALICCGEPGNYPRFWQNSPALYLPFLIGLTTIWALSPVILLLALRNFRRDVTGRTPRWLDPLIALVAAGELLALIMGLNAYLSVSPILGMDDGLDLISIGWSAGSILAPLALVAGWREVPAASRTRYAFMAAAISAFCLNAAVDPIIMLTGNDYVSLSWPVLVQLSALILGTVLFAYALLRHRVIDLGFAINRTLVFSALSFIVLVVFGFVEWGSEKLMPVASREASAAIDAAIALTLFMVFHRIHKWVEHGVERLFFHSWHLSQAALERFVGQASYITRAEMLLERAVEALRGFTGGAEVALYRSTPRGYARVAGGLAGEGALLDPDLPSLVALRAERAPLHDAFLGGSLTLPMTHRGDVIGFVVCGPKPSGDAYRRDEEMALAEAVRRVGLDLHALRVEELEAENARLTARLAPVAA